MIHLERGAGRGVEKWKGLYGLGFGCLTRFLILKCVFGLCEGREGKEQFVDVFMFC